MGCAYAYLAACMDCSDILVPVTVLLVVHTQSSELRAPVCRDEPELALFCLGVSAAASSRSAVYGVANTECAHACCRACSAQLRDESMLQGSHRQSWEYGPPAMRKGGADGARRFAHMVPRLNSVFHKLLGAVNKETGQPLTDLQIASVGNIFILAGWAVHACLSTCLHASTGAC